MNLQLLLGRSRIVRDHLFNRHVCQLIGVGDATSSE